MGRPKIDLTKEQVEEAQLHGKTFKLQADFLGVSEDVYRREKQLIQQSDEYKEEIKYLTERDPKLELQKLTDLPAFKKSCSDIYEKSRKTIGYNEITVDLGDDDCAVKLDCDWHIGNEMTNLDQWSEDVEFTVKTPRLFTILDGDYTDNLDAIRKAYESIISVPEAKQKVLSAVTMMGGKILGVVQGCHDEWFFNQDSWDISQYLAEHTSGYWLGFRGIVNIKLGEQKYKFYVRHKYRRHSTDNLCWGMLYKFRKLKQTMDVMMSGHHHHPDIRVAYDRGRKVYMIMGGSYKPYDRFIEHKDIDAAPPMMPAVILRADKHQVNPFIDFRELEDYF